MEQTEGMVKLLADGTTGRIVGCHVYGAHAADIVQEATALMSLGATVDQLASVVHIHPTLGELLQEAAL
jgi:dihydrolipoamide dehydrogenase